ncbi:MAG: putative viral replication protein [Cressdnaviricota sp.]|nr:MAG: putative viral replication protein [Cressdnaviricota sp.]
MRTRSRTLKWSRCGKRSEIHYYLTSIPNHYLIKSKMSRAINWCFTTNNYNDQHILRLRSLYEDDNCNYIVFGKEVGEQGTPHLQGFCCFKKRKTFNQVKALIPDSHLSVAKGSAAQNKKYCSKEGDWTEYGDIPSCQGKRTDLDELVATIKEGTRCKRVLYEQHREVCAKYPRFVQEYLTLTQPEPPVEDHPLHEWQRILDTKLKGAPNDREIVFVVDRTGGNGKTWFAKQWVSKDDKSQYLEMGKKADMAYALNPEITTLFVNCTRQQVEFLNYSFLESVKDGMVFSTKYESGIKKMQKCHVVVMMNQDPDREKLSQDRYKIIDI